MVMLAFHAQAHADGPVDRADLWARRSDIVFRPARREGETRGLLQAAAMVQDSEGFIWEGGETGLARWDGFGFRLYIASTERPDGLADHNVVSLHADSGGRLWVGTRVGGLARYDAASDHFEAIPLDLGPDRSIWSLADDGAGGLWVGTGSGLFHLDGAGRTVAHLRHDPAAADSLPDNKVEVLLRDSRGGLWLGGPAGLFLVSTHPGPVAGSGSSRFTAVALPLPDHGTPEVSVLFEDSAGRLWAGSRADGAFVIAPQGLDIGRGAARRIDQTIAGPGEAAAPEIFAIAEAGPGRIWLATAGRGIWEVRGPGLHVRNIRRDASVPDSLPKDNVTSLFRDRSGLVWVSTLEGLCSTDPGGEAFLTLFGDTGRHDGLRLNDASSILARPDGTIWVGSDAGGLQILDPAGAADRMLRLPRVFAMASFPAAGGDRSNPVYVGTRNGLYRADAAGSAIKVVDLEPFRDAGQSINALLALGDTLWLGGASDGLWRLQRKPDGNLTVVAHIAAPLLTNNIVNAIALAADGRIAVGTDNGFILLDPATDGVERYMLSDGEPDKPAPGAVMAFAVDRHGRLWVGTDSAGIFVLTGRDASGHPQFRHLGGKAGLQDLDISNLLVDEGGMIWASTDNGLAVINPDSWAVRPIQRPQGVAIESYFGNSADRTPAGELIFGGVGGMTIVQPRRVSPSPYQPPIVVTGIKLGGRAIAAGADRNGPNAGILDIPPSSNSLAVEFAALDFAAPELGRYSYRLEDFDSDWNETDAAHRTATYTNLPPGTYTLWLRGSNRDGIMGKATRALRVRVLPAWFQTGWFHGASAAAALLAVGALVQGRTQFLRRRQRELERLVQERTDALLASQRELQQIAFIDPLTALPNRRAFNDTFQQLIDLGRTKAFGLLLVDLDGFKGVNDRLGHQAGDALLVIVAERMRHAVREGDILSRLGGDEFAILMCDIENRHDVGVVCDRIVTCMAAPLSLKGTPVVIGASVGAALYPQHGMTQDDLFRHVDLALYEAKRTGRGGWRWYHASEACSVTAAG
jgi:diguanylate cyclase (GGDEF)-like protein